MQNRRRLQLGSDQNLYFLEIYGLNQFYLPAILQCIFQRKCLTNQIQPSWPSCIIISIPKSIKNTNNHINIRVTFFFCFRSVVKYSVGQVLVQNSDVNWWNFCGSWYDVILLCFVRNLSLHKVCMNYFSYLRVIHKLFLRPECGKIFVLFWGTRVTNFKYDFDF